MKMQGFTVFTCQLYTGVWEGLYSLCMDIIIPMALSLQCTKLIAALMARYVVQSTESLFTVRHQRDFDTQYFQHLRDCSKESNKEEWISCLVNNQWQG